LQRLVAEQVGPSAYGDVTGDVGGQEAQRRALQRLMSMGEDGYTIEDRAAIDAMLREVARQEQGQRQAILNDFRRRGTAGSGMEFASQLQAQQGAANRASA